jgi:hypothetical protein
VKLGRGSTPELSFGLSATKSDSAWGHDDQHAIGVAESGLSACNDEASLPKLSCCRKMASVA